MPVFISIARRAKKLADTRSATEAGRVTMPKFTTKETAAELRKHLRATWPTVKFSVRCGRGTASAWLRVAWVDGPAYTQAQS